jgi:hypothetical protein
MSLFTDLHHPYGDVAGINPGVRCGCGEDFAIGRSMPDTPKGKPSRRKLTKMIHCWDAYREHYAQQIVKHNAGVFTL